MEDKIVLQPFDRILSGYDRLSEVAVSIEECGKLYRKYESLGVQGYRVWSYQGASYLNYYLHCSVDRVPTLIYKNKYLIPLIFRSSKESEALFDAPYRMEGFFALLDWLVEHRPQKALIDYDKEKEKEILYWVVDSSYIAFRLYEIIEGAGFPLSHFRSADEFKGWNRIYSLINSDRIGRHSRSFDPSNPEQLSELQMILKIVKLKYPQTMLFV